MIDLSSITSNVSSLSDLILVTPNRNYGVNPQFSDGSTIPDRGFLFNISGEEILNLTSDITDHFIENNTSLQDQIALKPETFTVTGYVGELNNVTPKFLEPLKEASERLSLLSPFLPVISSSALIAYNTAAQLYATAQKAQNSAISVIDLLSGNEGEKTQTAQQKAFRQFYNWWQNHQLFSVQTPWAIMTDMAIMSLRITQTEDTRMISDIEVTFKKLRFAKTITTKKITRKSGRSSALAAPVSENGTTKPAEDGVAPHG